MATNRAPIKKVVFPVGGMGTRFLPATKAVPKEMFPVVDRPLIHYAFEEAREAGIEQFIFITARGKHAIEDHFDHAAELENNLAKKGKTKEIDTTSGWLPKPGNCAFIRQQEPQGLGHAVWCARHLIGNEPFAVILPDDMVHARKGCLKQMVDFYNEHGGNVLGVIDVPREKTSSYGIVDVEAGTAPDAKFVRARGLVEKPSPEKAPSTLSVIGRYILQPEVMQILETQGPGAGGEIQLTDAICQMIGKKDVFGYRFDGTRYDCGGLVGFVAAYVAYALDRPEIHDKMHEELNEVFSRIEALRKSA
ncbi:MAG: UTP--glucose-1-phosphate uridylyltransferase GalU [Rickettsiales bacterium]|nr:UTP--glucose-1-phosphate uridylyltransferase GalU [Rickettsiales bacterium]